MPATVLQDPELGTITIRRSRLARSIRLRVDHRGSISISMPLRTPLFIAKKLLNEARDEIRRNLASLSTTRSHLLHGDLIGKSHKLIIGEGDGFASRLAGTELHVTLPLFTEPTSPEAQRFIKDSALKALRTQARAYLSRRLNALALDHGFRFTSIRFSNAGTRWGSCSSRGTISLNIWLMQLPFELIDYVLVHELCHTREMNHSPRFWAHVEGLVPDYHARRKALKEQKPYM